MQLGETPLLLVTLRLPRLQDTSSVIWSFAKLAGGLTPKMSELLQVLAQQACKSLQGTAAATLQQLLHIVQG